MSDNRINQGNVYRALQEWDDITSSDFYNGQDVSYQNRIARNFIQKNKLEGTDAASAIWKGRSNAVRFTRTAERQGVADAYAEAARQANAEGRAEEAVRMLEAGRRFSQEQARKSTRAADPGVQEGRQLGAIANESLPGTIYRAIAQQPLVPTEAPLSTEVDLFGVPVDASAVTRGLTTTAGDFLIGGLAGKGALGAAGALAPKVVGRAGSAAALAAEEAAMGQGAQVVGRGLGQRILDQGAQAATRIASNPIAQGVGQAAKFGVGLGAPAVVRGLTQPSLQEQQAQSLIPKWDEIKASLDMDPRYAGNPEAQAKVVRGYLKGAGLQGEELEAMTSRALDGSIHPQDVWDSLRAGAGAFGVGAATAGVGALVGGLTKASTLPGAVASGATRAGAESLAMVGLSQPETPEDLAVAALFPVVMAGAKGPAAAWRRFRQGPQQAGVDAVIQPPPGGESGGLPPAAPPPNAPPGRGGSYTRGAGMRPPAPGPERGPVIDVEAVVEGRPPGEPPAAVVPMDPAFFQRVAPLEGQDIQNPTNGKVVRVYKVNPADDSIYLYDPELQQGFRVSSLIFQAEWLPEGGAVEQTTPSGVGDLPSEGGEPQGVAPGEAASAPEVPQTSPQGGKASINVNNRTKAIEVRGASPDVSEVLRGMGFKTTPKDPGLFYRPLKGVPRQDAERLLQLLQDLFGVEPVQTNEPGPSERGYTRGGKLTGPATPPVTTPADQQDEENIPPPAETGLTDEQIAAILDAEEALSAQQEEAPPQNEDGGRAAAAPEREAERSPDSGPPAEQAQPTRDVAGREQEVQSAPDQEHPEGQRRPAEGEGGGATGPVPRDRSEAEEPPAGVEKGGEAPSGPPAGKVDGTRGIPEPTPVREQPAVPPGGVPGAGDESVGDGAARDGGDQAGPGEAPPVEAELPGKPRLGRGRGGRQAGPRVAGSSVPKETNAREKELPKAAGKAPLKGVYVDEGAVYRKEVDEKTGAVKATKLKTQPGDVARITDALDMAGALDDFMGKLDAGELEGQEALRKKAEAFIKKHGDPRKDERLRDLMKGDPRLNWLRTLLTTADGELHPILTKENPYSALQPRAHNPKSINSSVEKLAQEGGLKPDGTLDLKRLGELYEGGLSPEELKEKLLTQQGKFFRQGDGVARRREFLSGDIAKKLAAAKKAGHEEEAKALESVLPEQKNILDVVGSGGLTARSPWLMREAPEMVDAFSEFYGGVFGFWRLDEKGKFIQISSSDASPSARIPYSEDNANEARQILGRFVPMVGKNASLADVMEAYLNGNTFRLSDDKIRMGHTKESLAARRLQLRDAVDAMFSLFLASDDKVVVHHRNKLQAKYNDQFRSWVTPLYGEGGVEIEGVSSVFKKAKDEDGKPWVGQHQVEFIARGLENGRGILAHDVGGGKTATAILLAQAMRQRGMLQRPMFVVPKKVIGKWEKEIAEIVPGARIVTLSTEGRKREEEMRRLQELPEGEVDYVLITHESFQSLPLSEQAVRDFYQPFLDEAPEKDAERLKEKVDKMVAKRKGDGIGLEEARIDGLFFDEAHRYKNVEHFFSGKRDVRTGYADSDVATDAMIKSALIRRNNKNRNVFLLTATPVTNSMIEIYNMLNFVAPDVWRSIGVRDIADFEKMFYVVGDVMKIRADGDVELQSAPVSYKNIQILRDIITRFTDFRSTEELGVRRPEASFRNVNLDPTPSQVKGFSQIVAMVEEAFDLLRSPKQEDREKGIALYASAQSKARALAVSAKLFSPQLEDDTRHENSKIKWTVDQVVARYQEGNKANFKNGQLIFLDRYGGSGEAREGWLDKDFHELLKDRLVEAGIPASQIAIINGNVNSKSDQKEKVADQFYDGAIRVVIGSTDAMGEGMDLQRRTTDIYHLDSAYTPAKNIQRNGRGLRQGNENSSIRIHYVATKGSMDASLYNIVKNKDTWQSKLWSGSTDSAADVDTSSVFGDDIEQFISSISQDPEKIERVRMQKAYKNSQVDLVAVGKRMTQAVLRRQVMRKNLKTMKAELAELEKDEKKASQAHTKASAIEKLEERIKKASSEMEEFQETFKKRYRENMLLAATTANPYSGYSVGGIYFSRNSVGQYTIYHIEGQEGDGASYTVTSYLVDNKDRINSSTQDISAGDMFHRLRGAKNFYQHLAGEASKENTEHLDEFIRRTLDGAKKEAARLGKALGAKEVFVTVPAYAGKVKSVIGSSVATKEDLDGVLEHLRNPRVEIATLLGIKDGKVAAHFADSDVDGRSVFIDALVEHVEDFLVKYDEVIYVHNHPSGDPTPSKEDLVVMDNLRMKAKKTHEAKLRFIVVNHKRYFDAKLPDFFAKVPYVYANGTENAVASFIKKSSIEPILPDPTKAGEPIYTGSVRGKTDESELMNYARQLRTAKEINGSFVLYENGKAEVVAVDAISAPSESTAGQFNDYIKNRTKALGVPRAILVVPHGEQYDGVPSSIYVAISLGDTNQSSSIQMGRGQRGLKFGRPGGMLADEMVDLFVAANGALKTTGFLTIMGVVGALALRKEGRWALGKVLQGVQLPTKIPAAILTKMGLIKEGRLTGKLVDSLNKATTDLIAGKPMEEWNQEQRAAWDMVQRIYMEKNSDPKTRTPLLDALPEIFGQDLANAAAMRRLRIPGILHSLRWATGGFSLRDDYGRSIAMRDIQDRNEELGRRLQEEGWGIFQQLRQLSEEDRNNLVRIMRTDPDELSPEERQQLEEDFGKLPARLRGFISRMGDLMVDLKLLHPKSRERLGDFYFRDIYNRQQKGKWRFGRIPKYVISQLQRRGESIYVSKKEALLLLDPWEIVEGSEDKETGYISVRNLRTKEIQKDIHPSVAERMTRKWWAEDANKEDSPEEQLATMNQKGIKVGERLTVESEVEKDLLMRTWERVGLEDVEADSFVMGSVYDEDGQLLEASAAFNATKKRQKVLLREVETNEIWAFSPERAARMQLPWELADRQLTPDGVVYTLRVGDKFRLRREWTMEEKQKMGLVEDALHVVAKTIMDAITNIKTGDYLFQIAQEPTLSTKDPEVAEELGWKQIPGPQAGPVMASEVAKKEEVEVRQREKAKHEAELARIREQEKEELAELAKIRRQGQKVSTLTKNNLRAIYDAMNGAAHTAKQRELQKRINHLKGRNKALKKRQERDEQQREDAVQAKRASNRLRKYALEIARNLTLIREAEAQKEQEAAIFAAQKEAFVAEKFNTEEEMDKRFQSTKEVIEAAYERMRRIENKRYAEEREAISEKYGPLTKVPDGYRRDDIYLPGTGVLKYGALAGMWVSPEVWNILQSQERYQSRSFWDGLLRQWKMLHTAGNPMTHFVNVLGNMVDAQIFAGDWQNYLKSWAILRDAAYAERIISANPDVDPKDLREKGSLTNDQYQAYINVQSAKEAGAFAGTFSAVELQHFADLIPEDVDPTNTPVEAAASFLRRVAEGALRYSFGKMPKIYGGPGAAGGPVRGVALGVEKWLPEAKTAVTEMSDGTKVVDLHEIMANFYQFEDEVLRFAIFNFNQERLRQTMEPEEADLEAARRATKYGTDYKVHAPMVRTAQQLGYPAFIVWSYRRIPNVKEMAFHYPHKVLELGMLMSMMNMASYFAVPPLDKPRPKDLGERFVNATSQWAKDWTNLFNPRKAGIPYERELTGDESVKAGITMMGIPIAPSLRLPFANPEGMPYYFRPQRFQFLTPVEAESNGPGIALGAVPVAGGLAGATVGSAKGFKGAVIGGALGGLTGALYAGSMLGDPTTESFFPLGIPSILSPGANPLHATYMGLLTNRDARLHKDIVNPMRNPMGLTLDAGDDPLRWFLDVPGAYAAFLRHQWLPNNALLLGSYQNQKLWDSLKGDRDWKGRLQDSWVAGMGTGFEVADNSSYSAQKTLEPFRSKVFAARKALRFAIMAANDKDRRNKTSANRAKFEATERRHYDYAFRKAMWEYHHKQWSLSSSPLKGPEPKLENYISKPTNDKELEEGTETGDKTGLHPPDGMTDFLRSPSPSKGPEDAL